MFPWNSLVFSMKAKATQLCMTLCNPMDCPWNSPGQKTGVGYFSLLQGIFPTQGLNPGVLHCRRILYQLSHKGSPRTLDWVAYPFSRGSSRPRKQTGVSCIAGRFFTNWAIRVANGPSFCILCGLSSTQVGRERGEASCLASRLLKLLKN